MEKEIFGTIVNMIKRHVEDKEICMYGCYLIQSVLNNANTSNSQNEAIKIGLLEVITGMISMHNRDADITVGCFKTLYFLISRTKCEETQKATDFRTENIKQVVETGAIEAVIKTMNEHINDIKICEWGCKVLTSIASFGKSYQQNRSYNTKYRRRKSERR